MTSSDEQEMGKVLRFPSRHVEGGVRNSESDPLDGRAVYVVKTRTGYWGAESIDASPSPTQPRTFAWTYDDEAEADRIAVEVERSGAEGVCVQQMRLGARR